MRHYERTGRPREALDCRIAMARLSVGMAIARLRRQNGLVDMRGWARSPGMTPELLKEAISRLDELAPDRLDYTLGTEAVVSHHSAGHHGRRLFLQVRLARGPPARVLLPVLYPWERTRATAASAVRFPAGLDRVELLADSFADPNAPPVWTRCAGAGAVDELRRRRVSNRCFWVRRCVRVPLGHAGTGHSRASRSRAASPRSSWPSRRGVWSTTGSCPTRWTSSSASISNSGRSIRSRRCPTTSCRAPTNRAATTGSQPIHPGRRHPGGRWAGE